MDRDFSLGCVFGFVCREGRSCVRHPNPLGYHIFRREYDRRLISGSLDMDQRSLGECLGDRCE